MRAATHKKHPIEVFFPETQFGGFTRVDGAMAFYLRVDSLLTLNDIVLDVGCGRGEAAEDPAPSRRRLRILRGRCAKVIGIDHDGVAADNPCIDEFRPIVASRWPVDDESIDLCLADNVLEHIAQPDAFVAECARVLKPGGFLCVKTANSLGYAALAARVIPNAAHEIVLRGLQPQRDSRDVFPTYYRCNSPRRLRATLSRCGFTAYVYGHGAEPAYLGFSRPTYALGIAWARLTPSVLQNTLFAFAVRSPRKAR